MPEFDISYEILKQLSERYLANPNTDGEFIVAITAQKNSELHKWWKIAYLLTHNHEPTTRNEKGD